MLNVMENLYSFPFLCWKEKVDDQAVVLQSKITDVLICKRVTKTRMQHPFDVTEDWNLKVLIWTLNSDICIRKSTFGLDQNSNMIIWVQSKWGSINCALISNLLLVFMWSRHALTACQELYCWEGHAFWHQPVWRELLSSEFRVIMNVLSTL